MSREPVDAFNRPRIWSTPNASRRARWTLEQSPPPGAAVRPPCFCPNSQSRRASQDACKWSAQIGQAHSTAAIPVFAFFLAVLSADSCASQDSRQPLDREVWNGHRFTGQRMTRRNNQRVRRPRRQRANRIGMVDHRCDRWRFGVETMRPTSTLPSPLRPFALSGRCVNPRSYHLNCDLSRFRFRDNRAGRYLPQRCTAPEISCPVPSRRHTLQHHVIFDRLV